MSRRVIHIVKELRQQATDPEYHPMIRALFKDAADLLDEIQSELEGILVQGDDHG